MDESNLGEPAVELSGLCLWVRKRQFPESTDPCDGNWLWVTARVQALGARVWVDGSILMTQDLEAWCKGCQALLTGRADSATLEPIEPELKITIRKADDAGHLEMQIDITPDHLLQKHTFQIEIDQSYLPRLISGLERTLAEFPVRRA